MRDILFRGKRIDNGKWVEGNLFVSDTDGKTHILVGTRRITIEWEVDPATVGQFTGLTDKNGKRIFEGDIVERHCHSAWSHRLQRCDISYGRDGFEARNHIEGLDSDYYTYVQSIDGLTTSHCCAGQSAMENARSIVCTGSNSQRRENKMKVYIAGKITGDSTYIEKFQRAGAM